MEKLKGHYQVKEHQLFISLPKIWLRLIQSNQITNRTMFWKISFFVVLTFPFQWIQKVWFYRKIKQVNLQKNPPVFILGHWRSGTTHLHYLMSKDPQFAYLSNYKAFLLNVCLLGRTWLKFILSPLMPEKRPQDNVPMSVDAPAEEEQPFTNLSTRSGMMSFFFPKNLSYHEKYNLFQGISKREKRLWKRDYSYLLKLISYSSGGDKPLVLKNPHNTSRVKELLELFPNAKFIFIHRNPYEVFHSSRHLYHTMISSQFLQDFSDEDVDERVFYNFSSTMKKYIEEYNLIPKGNLIEVSFDELEEDPLETMQMIYSKLQIPDFKIALPFMEEYLNKVKNYKKNKFPDLDDLYIQKINKDWDFAFQHWSYDKVLTNNEVLENYWL
ncbi:MAG: sulfotransferase [Chitinophagales bacterium]|nr:sulfotransferase [Chitinophagales bacterium]MCZ2392837.1 sulfotransferase [Chitinophagales bacterium]